jgi:hypothetical protein
MKPSDAPRRNIKAKYWIRNADGTRDPGMKRYNYETAVSKVDNRGGMVYKDGSCTNPVYIGYSS